MPLGVADLLIHQCYEQLGDLGRFQLIQFSVYLGWSALIVHFLGTVVLAVIPENSIVNLRYHY